MMMSYTLSFFFSLAFEAPTMTIEKVLLEPGGNTRKRDKVTPKNE